MLIITCDRASVRRIAKSGLRQRQEKRTGSVAHGVAYVTEKRSIEFCKTTIAIGILSGLHFLQDEWVATDSALAEYDQAAGENIRAFDGDGNWHGLVAAAEIIFGAQNDAFTAMNVHCIVGDFSAEFRAVIL